MDYNEAELKILELGDKASRILIELTELILTEQYRAERYWEED